MQLVKIMRKQRGDTIIEVLLALSVIGLVLGSSYAISNRSLQIGREAQERTEALKQVETQLERLRAVSATVDTTGTNPLISFPAATSAFCIDDSVVLIEFNRPDFGSFTDSVLDEVNYPQDISGNRPCNTGTDGRYGIVITKSDDTNPYLYTIRARWESIGGGPLKELKTQYRIYPVGNDVYKSIPTPTTFLPLFISDSASVSESTKYLKNPTVPEKNNRGFFYRLGSFGKWDNYIVKDAARFLVGFKR